MNLANSIIVYDIYAGGSGSGCTGPNCGRKSISLYNNNLSDGVQHNKVYHIAIEKHPSGGHVVNFKFGRKGSALQSGTKTPHPVDFATARKIFEKLVSKKINERGYSEM